MFHVELRRGTGVVCRYNLSEPELLLTILEPWVAPRPLTLGEHDWDPRESEITIIEAPELPVGQLTMGRGWSIVQRKGQNVTGSILALARARLTDPPVASAAGPPGPLGAPASGPPGASASGPAGPASREHAPASVRTALVDSLGLELLAELRDETREPSLAWSLAAARDPALEPAQSLGLAQEVLGSLLRSGLLAVSRADSSEPLERESAEALLRDPASWGMGEGGAPVLIRRS